MIPKLLRLPLAPFLIAQCIGADFLNPLASGYRQPSLSSDCTACAQTVRFLSASAFCLQDLLAKDARGAFVRFSETGAAQSQRRWCDGSLEQDLPMHSLSQQFGVNCFLAGSAG